MCDYVPQGNYQVKTTLFLKKKLCKNVSTQSQRLLGLLSAMATEYCIDGFAWSNDLCIENSKTGETCFFSGVYNLVKEKEYTPMR